ncbi:MAG: c-type cytochrome [Proteobacteria bacterium]|nr:c-type cytochrome [Desulfocapsa sp.]MBU3944282.1 c-type cytochrome [Pseudomonadota bacterium]MCG2745287.1 c-type cytochrome [Desulfobacteraceae bacterium]MBU4028210.1 c-type cytochrome [Pseudomonadota bacterium]MBU4042055.1 c-type cytochrome [Pseudomonadota bacterium]
MKRTMLYTALFTLAFGAGSASAIQLTPEEQMGRHVYMDKDLSLNRTQSCATCHHRTAGFADPTNSRDPYNTMVSLGDDGISKGGRNAPTSAYCGFSPILQQVDGEYFGGMFWDGRKTGKVLGDPLAEQAQGPPLNPVEMGLALPGDVVIRVSESRYANLFVRYFGPDFFAVLGDDETDDGYLDAKADAAYAKIARMVAAYERSAEVTAFTSKFDTAALTAQELAGQKIFNENCSSCHTDKVVGSEPAPLFTNYGYVNVGVPVNTRLLTVPGTVYDGKDFGLGPVVGDTAQNGKFKVPTLRNITMTAPYSHNGYFTTLKEMISFMNDRGGLVPEVDQNVTTATGDMGLIPEELDDIYAFLNTLTDK